VIVRIIYTGALEDKNQKPSFPKKRGANRNHTLFAV